MCGSNEIVALTRIETRILNELSFKCQHEADGCDKVIKYSDIKNHLRNECIKKIQVPDDLEIKVIDAKPEASKTVNQP